MALTNAQRAVIAERRQLVARMRVRQLTEREIEDALTKPGKLNPATNEPWSHGTIHADIAALEAEWKAVAIRDIAEAKGLALAELREVKRKGWQDGDMDVVLKAIKQEADIKGLNAPTKITATDITGEHEYGRLSDADLDRQIASALARAVALPPGGAPLSLGPASEAESASS